MQLPPSIVALSAGLATIFAMQRSRGRGAPTGAVAATLAGTVASFATYWALRLRQASLCLSAYARYPRQYVAVRGTPPVIDGDIHKEVWSKAVWSEPFVEIRGHRDAPPGTGPTAAQSTKMKMLWDDEYLYIAAIMDYPAGDQFVAKFTERNSPIFHTDSDFEVFVDPAGCCHGYKELEMNPINTVWNLMLTRPYMDGGGERSGRVAKPGEKDHWEVTAQKTAARMLRGKLGDPSQPSQWCCEIALAHSDTLPFAPVLGEMPAVGKHWRINFSRVESGGKINWVWAPQVIWSPDLEKQGYAGQVNMHLPDAYGYLVFADPEGKLLDGTPASAWRDPAWPARLGAAGVYYAIRAFKDANQRLPRSIGELRDSGLLGPGATILQGLTSKLATSGTPADAYVASVTGNGWEARINHERLMSVHSA